MSPESHRMAGVLLILMPTEGAVGTDELEASHAA